jgi:hypothetical protein
MLRSLNNIHATWQTVYCVFIFCSEKNGVDQDQKILTDEQPAIEGNKGAPESKNFSGWILTITFVCKFSLSVFFLEKWSVLFFFYLAVHGIQIGILVSFSIYLLLYENMIASSFGLLIFTVVLLTKIYIL